MSIKNLFWGFVLVVVFFVISVVEYVAADEYVYAGGWSYHINEHPRNGDRIVAPKNHKCHRYGQCVEGVNSEKFSNDHHMLGYQAKGFMVAHYDNSFGQSTWLVAKHWEKEHPDVPVAFIAQIGATNGYTDCDFEDSGTSAKTCPYYQVGFAITKFKVQPVFSTSGSVFMMSLRYRI
jgi:hypothetical protein